MSNLAFNSISDALIMDGHGVFVWSVFLIFLVVISLSFKIFNSLIKKYKSQIR